MSRENLIFLYYSFFILLVVCAGNKGKIRGLKKIGQFFFGFFILFIVCFWFSLVFDCLLENGKK
mgnify:CR=1 FL=1